MSAPTRLFDLLLGAWFRYVGQPDRAYLGHGDSGLVGDAPIENVARPFQGLYSATETRSEFEALLVERVDIAERATSAATPEPAGLTEDDVRAGFRAYDGRGSAGNQTRWQVWRDAVAWATPTASMEPVAQWQAKGPLDKDWWNIDADEVNFCRVKRGYHVRALGVIPGASASPTTPEGK